MTNARKNYIFVGLALVVILFAMSLDGGKEGQLPPVKTNAAAVGQ